MNVEERLKRLRRAELFIRDHVSEVTNNIGGVVGYELHLDEHDTKTLWDLLTQDQSVSTAKETT